MAHQYWPNAQRSVITNGTNVSKIEKLAKVFCETNTSIGVSFHSTTPKYLELMRPSIKRLIRLCRTEPGLSVSIMGSVEFIRYHKGIGPDMLPYADGDPKGSWEKCGTRACMSIADGRLWKCPVVAGLPLALAKFDLLDHPAWQPYLDYHGCGLEASQDELLKFLHKNTGPEAICGMCPVEGEMYQKDVFSSVEKHVGLPRAEASGTQNFNLSAFVDEIRHEVQTEPA